MSMFQVELQVDVAGAFKPRHKGAILGGTQPSLDSIDQHILTFHA